MNEMVAIILVCIALMFMCVYSYITLYETYVLFDNKTKKHQVVKVIGKNPLYVTLSYTDKPPVKMATIWFLIKTLNNI